MAWRVATAVAVVGLGITSLWLGQWFWAGCAVVLVCCALCLHRLARNVGAVGWSTAVPAFYLLYFVAYPVVLDALGSEKYAEDNGAPWTLFLVAAGVLSFAAGSNMVTSRLGAKAKPRLYAGWCGGAASSWKVVLAMVVCGTAASLYSVFYGYYGLTSSIVITSPVAGVVSAATVLLGVGLVLAVTNCGKGAQARWVILAFVAFAISLGLALFSKSKGALVFPLVYVAAAVYVARGRLPRGLILTTVIIYFFFAYPFVTSWRQAGRVEYESRVEQVEEGYEHLLAGKWWEDRESDSQEQTRGLGRGLLRVVTAIVQETGRTTPYEDGQSYLEAMAFLVPRFLWPEKPSMGQGNYIGKKYQIIGSEDERTNVAPTVLGEMYMNFGVWGVLVGMYLWGMLAGFADLAGRRYAGMWIFAWAWPTAFFGQEATVGHLVIPFVKSLSMVLLTLYLSRWWVCPQQRVANVAGVASLSAAK